jgi:hypothetical protein
MFKLFRTALQYEVQERISAVREFSIGHPTVIRLVMAHHRGSGAGKYLANALGPFVQKLLQVEELDLNVEPVELYKAWRNKEELTTGQKSALPFDVTREAALEYPAVRDALDKMTSRVIELCTDLLVMLIHFNEVQMLTSHRTVSAKPCLISPMGCVSSARSCIRLCARASPMSLRMM